MSNGILYEDLDGGLFNLDQLVFYLDRAMWLLIEYDGQPSSTLVNLSGARKDFEARVDNYLAEHRAELLVTGLRCPKCGSKYWKYSSHKTCPMERIPWEREQTDGLSPDQVLQLPPERCGGVLQEVLNENPNEEYLREQATDRVYDESTRLQMIPYQVYEQTGSHPLPLQKALECFSYALETNLDFLVRFLAELGDPVYLTGRRDLLPTGKTLQDKHSDYLLIRNKLINCYNRVFGLATNCPEHAERERQPYHRGVLPWSPAITLPHSKAPDGTKQTLSLADIPPLDKESGEWITQPEVVRITKNTTNTLSNRRLRGTKNPDGTAGIDLSGGMWRKDSPNARHVWYFKRSVL